MHGDIRHGHPDKDAKPHLAKRVEILGAQQQHVTDPADAQLLLRIAISRNENCDQQSEYMPYRGSALLGKSGIFGELCFPAPDMMIS